MLATRGLLEGIYVHGFIGYDWSALHRAMHAGGVFRFGFGRCSRPIDAANRALLAVQRQGTDLTQVCSVHLGVSGGADLTLSDIDQVVGQVQEQVGSSAVFEFYSTVRDELGGVVEVSLLAASETRLGP